MCCSKYVVCPQVRSKAQSVLFTAMGTYNFCCRDITPRVLELLEPDRTNVTRQQFKVCNTHELHIVKIFKMILLLFWVL